MKKAPNLLFVTADQWRGDAQSRLGHRAALTPHLDRFAEDAVAFNNHWANCTPCGPSRATIHTGLYAFNHRSITNGTPLDGRHKNWAEILDREGYGKTALFGYTDTSVDPRLVGPGDPRLSTYESVAPGFDETAVIVAGMAPWLEDLAAKGYGAMTQEEAFATPLGEPALFRAEDSLTAFQCRQFLDWHAAQKGRWQAHLSLFFPHPPYVAPAPFHDRVPLDAIPAPLRAPTIEEEAAAHPWLAAWLKKPHSGDALPQAGPEPSALTDDRVRTLRRVYFGLVQEFDHHFGALIDTLAARGALDDTLIVVSSDHGELIGDHWGVGKTTFFSEAFHAPLLIRPPGGVAGGRSVAAFTGHVDLAPTILDGFGIEAPLQCDGHSLAPWLDGERPAHWRDAITYEHDCRDLSDPYYERALGLGEDETNIAVRLDARHAYVQFAASPPLLFDRAADPAWRTNLLAAPGAEAIAFEKAEALLRHRLRYAERRLTGVMLTDDGPIGRYDHDGRIVTLRARAAS